MEINYLLKKLINQIIETTKSLENLINFENEKIKNFIRIIAIDDKGTGVIDGKEAGIFEKIQVFFGITTYSTMARFAQANILLSLYFIINNTK